MSSMRFVRQEGDGSPFVDAERIDALLSTGVTALSHDLRGRLLSIRGFAQLLARKLDDDGIHEHLVQIIRDADDATRRLSAAVRFLRLAQQPLRFEPVDVMELVQEVVRDIREMTGLPAESIRVDDLPKVHSDVALCREIFRAVIENAVQMRSPDRDVEIHIRSVRHDGFIEFAVDDNGVGIEPEYVSRIFELFRVLEASDEHVGAGLAIAAMAAARLGGGLRCDPRREHGTSFVLTLPTEASSPLVGS